MVVIDNNNNNNDNGNQSTADDGSLHWSAGLGGENNNALSSLLCDPTSLLVQMKNEWDISHSR